jgi:hypothetical protein
MGAMTDGSGLPGFEADIRPLFRPVDVEHMGRMGVHLDHYAYMSVPENARRVYESIAAKRMPPPVEGATWSDVKVELLQDWIAGGYQP